MSRPYPFSSELLAGQTALVTGGGTGLGKATAQSLLQAGARVRIAARREDVLAEAAEELRSATGGEVETHVLNIRDRDAVEALANEIPAPDILVNNAGGQFPVRARDLKPKGWNAVIDLNLNGTWNMTQIFGDRMLSGAGGAIVQVIAVIGRGFPGLAHSAAARAGVLELSRTLAYEWAPRVRLNCVAPGPIVTPGFAGTYHPKILEAFEGVPLEHPGTPEDAAHAITYLASSAAEFITGEVLYVAGGQQSMGRNQALFDSEFHERRPDEAPASEEEPS